jgi:hypothetical protein
MRIMRCRMFRIPKVNVIESDEGFSIKVEMRRLVYTEGPKTLFIESEILSSPGNIGIWKDSIVHWEYPYHQAPINEKKRKEIIENIRRAFHWKGETISIA